MKLFEQDEELFMKTRERELLQASEVLKAQTGEDSKSIRLSDIDANWFAKLFTTSKDVDKSTIKIGTVFK